MLSKSCMTYQSSKMKCLIQKNLFIFSSKKTSYVVIIRHPPTINLTPVLTVRTSTASQKFLLVIKNEMSRSKEPFYLFFQENFRRCHSSSTNQSNTCTVRTSTASQKLWSSSKVVVHYFIIVILITEFLFITVWCFYQIEGFIKKIPILLQIPHLTTPDFYCV